MNIKSTELNGYSANDILRYGVIHVSLTNYNERYFLVSFKGRYYEFNVVSGELESITVNNKAPKYMNTLVRN